MLQLNVASRLGPSARRMEAALFVEKSHDFTERLKVLRAAPLAFGLAEVGGGAATRARRIVCVVVSGLSTLPPGPFKLLALFALIWRLKRLFLFWVYGT